MGDVSCSTCGRLILEASHPTAPQLKRQLNGLFYNCLNCETANLDALLVAVEVDNIPHMQNVVCLQDCEGAKRGMLWTTADRFLRADIPIRQQKVLPGELIFGLEVPRTCVIFNGPIESGKDTAARLLTQLLPQYTQLHTFKAALVDITCRIYKVTAEWWAAHYATHALKATKYVELQNQSPREALIHVSEHVLKPSLGRDVIGQLFIKGLQSKATSAPLIVASDGGFAEEIGPLIKEMNVVVLKLEREGCNFTKPDAGGQQDSRSYLPDVLLSGYAQHNLEYHTRVIQNDGTLEDLQASIERVLIELLCRLCKKF